MHSVADNRTCSDLGQEKFSCRQFSYCTLPPTRKVISLAASSSGPRSVLVSLLREYSALDTATFIAATTAPPPCLIGAAMELSPGIAVSC